MICLLVHFALNDTSVWDVEVVLTHQMLDGSAQPIDYASPTLANIEKLEEEAWFVFLGWDISIYTCLNILLNFW